MNEHPDDAAAARPRRVPPHERTEGFGGGHIRSRHGRLNAWLLVVYAALFAWAVYYAVVFWGGLGPGLDLTL